MLWIHHKEGRVITLNHVPVFAFNWYCIMNMACRLKPFEEELCINQLQ